MEEEEEEGKEEENENEMKKDEEEEESKEEKEGRGGGGRGRETRSPFFIHTHNDNIHNELLSLVHIKSFTNHNFIFSSCFKLG